MQTHFFITNVYPHSLFILCICTTNEDYCQGNYSQCCHLEYLHIAYMSRLCFVFDIILNVSEYRVLHMTTQYSFLAYLSTCKSLSFFFLSLTRKDMVNWSQSIFFKYISPSSFSTQEQISTLIFWQTTFFGVMALNNKAFFLQGWNLNLTSPKCISTSVYIFLLWALSK